MRPVSSSLRPWCRRESRSQAEHIFLLCPLLLLLLGGTPATASAQAPLLSVHDASWPLDAHAAFRLTDVGLAQLATGCTVSFRGQRIGGEESEPSGASRAFLLTVLAESAGMPGCELAKMAFTATSEDAVEGQLLTYRYQPQQWPSGLETARWVSIQTVDRAVPEWGLAAVDCPASESLGVQRVPELGLESWLAAPVLDKSGALSESELANGVSGEAREESTLRDALRAGPNPYSDRLTLALTSPAAGSVDLLVADASGRVLDQTRVHLPQPGTHSYTWDQLFARSSGVPAGCHFVRARFPDGRTIAVPVIHLGLKRR